MAPGGTNDLLDQIDLSMVGVSVSDWLRATARPR